MVMRTLSREACLQLLSQVPVGRVGVCIRAMPAIFPVNFRVNGDEGTILFAAMANSRVALSTDNAIIAFQADSYDPMEEKGWTVLGIGRSMKLDDRAVLAALRGGVPTPWAVGEAAEHVMCLQLHDLEGHEIT